MRAMVLAAGLGTRLRPMTLEVPKPAVPVMNRPLVAFTLDHLARSGGTFAALNAHHLADVLERTVERVAPRGLDWTVLREKELLGTGGGIRNAASALLAGDPSEIVVLNSDILFAPDLEAAIATHRRHGAVATMVLRADPEVESYGSIEIDPSGRVRRMLGRPERFDAALESYMFTGVHVLSPAAFADLPEQGCIVREAYRRWVDGVAVVAGHVDATPWRDLGTPGAYLEANLDLLTGRLRWPGVQAPPGGSLVDPSAELGAGARVHRSVVGPGARVAPGVRVDRCVVWAGARVDDDVADAIVTPRAVVRV